MQQAEDPVIEGERTIRTGLVDVSAYRYAVDVAEDRERDLALAPAGNFYLGLLDVMLPGRAPRFRALRKPSAHRASPRPTY